MQGCCLKRPCARANNMLSGLIRKQIVELGQEKQRLSDEVDQLRDAMQEQVRA